MRLYIQKKTSNISIIRLSLFCACLSVIAANAQITIYKAKGVFSADTAIKNANCVVVDGGKILYTGLADTALKLFPGAVMKNFKNSFIYPGFRDAHCHFLAWCRGLKECDLTGSKSEAEVIKRLQKFSKMTQRSWLVGRGWDQNDWKNKEFPGIENLDKAFPDRPVCLKRVDGHAIWINSAAVKALKLNVNQTLKGGELLFKDGKFTGIMIDNAADLVTPLIPPIPENELRQAIAEGAQKCINAGITGLDEAGLEPEEIEYLEKLQLDGVLNLRINAMLAASEKNLAWVVQNGIRNNGKMRVGSMKFYLDGALGSRGALMKKDYCDRLGHKGLQLTDMKQFEYHARFLYARSYQVCVHAIGDSANKLALQSFSRIVDTFLDTRWRIEHAQIVDPKDFKLFKLSGTIPSVQPTHATSDAPWAESRLCESRMNGAYNYAELLRQSGTIALGTDFPVEDIYPLHTFYSAVFRQDIKGNLKQPFLPQGSLTPTQALLGMTLWAAHASKLENETGSLTPGKYADFVVINTDLLTASASKVKKAKITATCIDGKMLLKK